MCYQVLARICLEQDSSLVPNSVADIHQVLAGVPNSVADIPTRT